ncbi:MAG: PAS domain-containing protein [Lentisphaerae bacterium]|nr:PAS domain-containing protein [Lentisphaerota bacterium]
MTQEKASFLDRFIERLDTLDSNSLQAYIVHLFRERGFFESVFNAIHEGILVIDRHLAIKYFNGAARNLLGLPEDCRKVRINKLLPQLDWRKILGNSDESWNRMARQEIETDYPVHRWLQVYVVPQKEADERFAVIILHDVTEHRKQTDAELESRTAGVVAMLAGSVAHEIGNPLNSLYLNLQLLEHDLRDGGELDREDALETVVCCRGEVQRLDNLIRQFLNAVRPAQMNFQLLDLRELLLDTLKFMRHELKLRSLTVNCDFPESWPMINGDAEQLKQAFYNIIKNAAQAMSSGGELLISGVVDDSSVKLGFADTGKGVNVQELSRMFEPFASFKKGGNGLGMMIIERVVRAHGAELMLDSAPNAGMTLTISFPREGRRTRMLPEYEPGDGNE